jgi:hypothetical protein
LHLARWASKEFQLHDLAPVVNGLAPGFQLERRLCQLRLVPFPRETIHPPIGRIEHKQPAPSLASGPLDNLAPIREHLARGIVGHRFPEKPESFMEEKLSTRGKVCRPYL